MIYLLEHCPPNPTMEYAESVVLKVPLGTTEIVSHGGGSTIDVGKWVARRLHLKHTVIPTTAGTGSEVTKFCVLTVDGKKTTHTDDAFIPQAYILDPREIMTCPYQVALSAGLDAYSQALESWWSNNSTLQSHRYSDVAILMIEENLIKALDNRFDEKAQMNMLIASNMAGRAINITRTNVCHAISYPLTEIYGIPHGLACAITLPYFARKAIGLDITHFLNKLIMPRFPIDREKIADIAILSEKIKDFPGPVFRDDIIRALS